MRYATRLRVPNSERTGSFPSWKGGSRAALPDDFLYAVG
jgi:hypothetical protein